MSPAPTCGCCLRPAQARCRCHENESCPRCGACVEHCRCGGFTSKFEAVPEPRDACATCRFWKEICSGVGQCRRRAPRPVGPGGGPLCWPQTFDGDWCGEFEPRAVAETKGMKAGAKGTTPGRRPAPYREAV